jgi:hypothetical protein
MTNQIEKVISDLEKAEPFEGEIVRHLISHSEVEALGQCERKWGYAHLEKLQPVTHSAALNKGNAGHFIIETFLKFIKEGMYFEEAAVKAIKAVYEEDFPIEIIGEAVRIAKPWMNLIWPRLGWKIVAVEKEFRLSIGDDLVYPFKVDAIVEIRGELVLVDHKFVFDTYDDNTIHLMPQMPRYIGALRMMGIDVRYGIYNFLRTRKLKVELDQYSQEVNKVTDARIRHSMLEQVQEMRKIQALKDMPESERPILVRTVNKMNCAHCGFVELCRQELETGKVALFMRRTQFEPNTYGYKELTD